MRGEDHSTAREEATNTDAIYLLPLQTICPLYIVFSCQSSRQKTWVPAKQRRRQQHQAHRSRKPRKKQQSVSASTRVCIFSKKLNLLLPQFCNSNLTQLQAPSRASAINHLQSQTRSARDASTAKEIVWHRRMDGRHGMAREACTCTRVLESTCTLYFDNNRSISMYIEFWHALLLQ